MKATATVRPLDDLTSADRDSVGTKAALLGELRAAGFPVPLGYVIPADVLAGVDVGARTLPDGVLAAIGDVAASFDGPVAVRSSATAEDLPTASYAGQYESVLDVNPTVDALADAVRVCLRSAHGDRVARYEMSKAEARPGRMSVLIQRMVPAAAAGVAFTANPVTGDRREVVINSVLGLGERLVSGRASGDQWSVRDGGAHLVSAAERAIDASQAARIAELARQVEKHFAGPQDIEWAIADGIIWLVQARPVTALPDPPSGVLSDDDVPPGFWQRSTYAPEPVSPMFRSMMLPGMRDLTENLFPYSLGERIELRVIGGWLYSRFVRAERPGRIRAKLRRAMDAVRRDEQMNVFREWFDTVEPTMATRFARLRDEVDLAHLPDLRLLSHLDEVLESWLDAVRVHFRIGGSGTFILGELGIACRALLGWDAPEALALLIGLQGKTTEPAYRLADLVAMARDRYPVKAVIEAAGGAEPDVALSRLVMLDPGFCEALSSYLRSYGHRTLGMDIIEPTIAERPWLVVNLIRGQLASGFDPVADTAALRAEREKAETEARRILAGRPREDSERFEAVLSRAQYMHPGRDDSHYLTQVGAGLLRRAVREIGRRLVQRGVITSADDVFLLERDEATAALMDYEDRTPLVERRRAERTAAQANRGPDSYGEPPDNARTGGAGDWLAELPAPARHIMSAGLWAWQEVSGERARHLTKPVENGFLLRGIAGSRGRYTGPVRIVNTETEFDKLQPGDVLVCPETNPQWSVLFPGVGALITNHGGLLSHPAIIAREYRVPAVLATGTATSLLRDGQVVTVDGNTGTVELVSVVDTESR